MRLEDSRILVTGAGGGIGSAVARALGRHGATLLLTDINPTALQRVESELRNESVCVISEPADVTNDSERKSLVRRAHRAGINALINIAGINPFGMFENQTEAQIASTIQINAIAPILLCRAMLPVLRDNTPGRIVNFGSSFGSIGYPGFAAYSASKFAIHGFSEALRRELHGSGVSVHYVAPRATKTQLATDRIRAMNDELKVGMDTPEVVASAVVDLLTRGRRERFLGAPERLFARINGVLPGLVDRAIAKQLPIIRRYAGGESEAAASSDDVPVEIHQNG